MRVHSGRRAEGWSSRRVLKLVIGLCLLVALLAGGYVLGRYLENGGYEDEPRSVMSEGFGQYETREYGGETYIRRANQTAMLLIGVDRREDQVQQGYRNGGQADFLLLVVLDHSDKTVHQLQIERDTITDVVTLGVLGNRVGTRKMQICLSHGFGAGEEESCRLTMEAVANLLQGVEPELYVSLDMRAMATLNDALGGVTVTIEDDFTAHDAAMAPGTTLRLTGEQAELYLSSRLTIGDGTNASRMNRHKAFMASAADILKQQVSQDSNFLDTLLDQLGDSLATNMHRGRLINEVNRAYKYDILPVQRLTGEYKLGNDGFVEFHPDTQSVIDWVLDVFYRPSAS